MDSYLNARKHVKCYLSGDRRYEWTRPTLFLSRRTTHVVGLTRLWILQFGYRNQVEPGEIRYCKEVRTGKLFQCLARQVHSVARALPKNRLYSAVKILTTFATIGVAKGRIPGPDAYRRIAEVNPRHIGYKYCHMIRDSFETKGFHGSHACIVTDPLGSNLGALRRAQPSRVFSIDTAKRITKQTLLALDYLHRESKYVHTDVKPENLLVSLENIDDQIATYIEENPSSTYEPIAIPEI